MALGGSIASAVVLSELVPVHSIQKNKMSLRSCLFARKVFNTKGEEEGTIRVEFIPKIKRSPLRDITPRKRRSELELDCDEDLSSDSSVETISDTQEF